MVPVPRSRQLGSARACVSGPFRGKESLTNSTSLLEGFLEEVRALLCLSSPEPFIFVALLLSV